MGNNLISLAFVIEPQAADDAEQVEALLDRAFGPDRYGKTAYRLRENVEPIHELSLAARDDRGSLLGTIRFWPILVEPADGAPPVPALLLGPLAVQPELKGKGVGIALMREGLARAKEAGHSAVILVGDYDYYSRVGFRRMAPGQFSLPGPVDEARLLYLELISGTLEPLTGRLVSLRT